MNKTASLGRRSPVKDLLIADRADILIVKNEVEDMQVLIALLSPHHNVHAFAEVHAALRYITAGHSVDLVVLNVEIPSLQGRDICRELRKMHELVDIPILAVNETASKHKIR